MQYAIYTHNYGCWSSNEGFPGNLEKPNNMVRYLNTHPGDFHCMLMFFSLFGSYLKGSGFDEIIFQTKLCT